MENKSMHLKIGTTLQGGKYRISRIIGRGGFGITYEAEQVILRRKVAIKEFFMKDYCTRSEDSFMVLSTQNNCSVVEKFRAKFIREAQMIASFDNPHIIRIFDIFEENGTAYYVMEHVAGGTLFDIVKNDGPMPEESALNYIRQVAEALRHVHSFNTVHLDVKPSILLLNSKGDAVLIDFGISKHYDDSGEQTSTSPVGRSKGYAPLEQYRDGDVSQFKPSTDIYSLGATLYFLVTGQVPPDASIVNEDGLDRIAAISDKVWNAINTAMQPRRKDRPQTIDAFLALIDSSEKIIENNTSVANNLDEEETQIIEKNTGSVNNHDWVDLGLPSGLKWATNNIGAKTPEDRGDYFAWGEVTPKINYGWSYYKYRNQMGNQISKYCGDGGYGIIDNKFVLEESDDAASVNWGGRWRTPTKEEFEELKMHCEFTWEDRSGIKGFKVTSKTNGHSIFFPAAGYYDKDGFFSEDETGNYWSSSVTKGDRPYDAWDLYFSKDNVFLNHDYRHHGLNIRPVIG